MNILNEIAEKTRERIEKDKKEMPREDLIREIRQKKVQMLLNPLTQSETAKTPHSFYQALKKPGMSYICEVKKASPSKGLIAPDFPYLEIAKEYKEAGAAAIKDGTMLGTVKNDAQAQGKAAMDLLVLLAKGETPNADNYEYEVTDDHYVWVPYAKITADTIDE